MKKIIALALSLIVCLAAAGIISAADNGKNLPKDIEKIEFIHYKNGSIKENPARAAKTATCYGFLTKRAVKWNTLSVQYHINPANSENLTSDFICGAFKSAAGAWDNSTSKALFNDYSGGCSFDAAGAYGARDNKNSIVFGNYSDPNVIAVTSIWYSQTTGLIYEFDMLYNSSFAWGDASINPALMDLQNIATHELGHAIGLNDMYNSACAQVTMYGYSSEGDLIKRTLEQPDIMGLQKLYGP